MPDHARWSPPIPTGAAANTAWRELDRRTRRDLLLRSDPHPDPMVACVALGHARTRLDAWPLTTLVRLGVLVVLSGSIMVVGLVVAVRLNDPAVVTSVVISLITALVLGLVIHTVSAFFQLVRMENVNAPALLAGEVPPPPAVPATGEPLAVAYAPRAVLRWYAVVTAVSAFIELRMFLDRDLLRVPFSVLFAALLVFMGHRLFAWVLPRRPVLGLDEDGILVKGGLSAPWEDITEIRVLPHRGATTGSEHRVVVFVCADPVVPLAELTGLKRILAERALTYYGSPLAMSTRGLDHTVEQILAAATALHPVPVRNFAP
jgi:hypothetical protein